MLAAALVLWAAAATASRPVAVVTPLETQNYSLGRQSGTAHAYIEDALLNSGTASKAGFQPWNKRVQPREGMQINVELASEMPPQ